MPSFSEKRIALRRQRGLSQEQLGAELGVSRQTVSKWEGGQSCPDFQRLVLLATSLSCRWTSWSGTRPPYAVIHRMAFDRRFVGRGLSAAALRLAEDLCREQGAAAIRIDTDPQNRRMQHILEKNGYRRCGTVLFQVSGKVAFDKAL